MSSFEVGALYIDTKTNKGLIYFGKINRLGKLVRVNKYNYDLYYEKYQEPKEHSLFIRYSVALKAILSDHPEIKSMNQLIAFLQERYWSRTYKEEYIREFDLIRHGTVLDPNIANLKYAGSVLKPEQNKNLNEDYAVYCNIYAGCMMQVYTMYSKCLYWTGSQLSQLVYELEALRNASTALLTTPTYGISDVMLNSVDYNMNWMVGQGYTMSDKKKRYS